MQDRLQFRMDPGRTAIKLSVAAFVLLVAHMVISYLWAHGGPQHVKYYYVDMFDLDEEKGFGTWFAAVTLLFVGRLLLIAHRGSRQARDGLALWWIALALGFHFLSVDEVAGMHEYLNSYGDDLLGLESKWTTYAFVVVSLVGSAYIPFALLLWMRGHRRTVILFAVAAVLYVGGAVGVEEMSPDDSLNSLAYNLGWITVEEGLEMAGVILMIYAVLDYLRGRATDRVRLDVYTEPAPAE